MLKVAHSCGIAWHLALAAKAKALGFLGSKYIRTVDYSSMEQGSSNKLASLAAYLYTFERAASLFGTHATFSHAAYR